jgi:hypothetical protein
MILEQGNPYHGALICPYCGISQEHATVSFQEKVQKALQDIKNHGSADAVVVKEQLATLVFPNDKTFNTLAACAVLFDLVVQDEDYRRFALNHRALLQWLLERIASPLPGIADAAIMPLLVANEVTLLDWLSFEIAERWQHMALCAYFQRNPQVPPAELLRVIEGQGKRFVGFLKKLSQKGSAEDEHIYQQVLQRLTTSEPANRGRFLQQVRKTDATYGGYLERDLLAALPTTALSPPVPISPTDTSSTGAGEVVAQVTAGSTAALYAPVQVSLPAPSWNPAKAPVVSEKLSPEYVPLPATPPAIPSSPERGTSGFRRAFSLVIISLLLLGYAGIAIYYHFFLQPLATRTVNNSQATVTSLSNQNILLQNTVTASIRNQQATATATLSNQQATATALAGGTFGAAFVGQTPMVSAHAGEAVVLYFILQNTGTSIWSHNADYQFVCVSGQPQNQSSQYVASCLNAPNPSPLGNEMVLPHQYYLFYFSAQIPFSAPPHTTYRTQWQLQHQAQTSAMGYITLVVS